MQFQTASHLQRNTDLLALMAQSRLFDGLNNVALETVYYAGTVQKYPKDSYLFYEDEPAHNISMVLDGVIHLSQLTVKGQQVIMHYLSPGDEIGILALFPDQVYPVTAVAATDSTVLNWPSQTLSSLFKEFPQMALNALQMMTERFVVLQNQFRQLATERAEQRIARTLLKIAQKSGKKDKNGIRLTPPPSRQQIAEMTGTTLYTVSRICSQWEKDEVVHTNRHSLIIKNKKALKAIVEEYALE